MTRIEPGSTGTDYGTVEVLFHLDRVEGWPPCDAETITCVLGDAGTARVAAMPFYANGLSRGDVVAVRHDGAGFVAHRVVGTGGHSTVHVVTATRTQAAGLCAALQEVGWAADLDARHPLVAVDVPPEADLDRLLTGLDDVVSAECNYVVSCRQHAPDLAGGLPALAARMRGRLVLPTDPDWDTARAAWNLALDLRPAAVAYPVDAAEVATVVRAAARLGLRVAPQSGRHNAGPLGDLTGTVLLRTTHLTEVSVDVAGRRVRVGTGALWRDVNAALAGTGLAPLAGSSGDVGVAGYVLGGGYSWLGRRFGLAATHVLAAEVVTGAGEVKRVDADHDPELFWAVRGGGGNGVVVTSLDLRVFDVDTVYAGTLFFPLERAREVLTAAERWTRTLPDEATVCLRLLRMPPLPELPPFLSGQSFVAIDGAITGDPAAAAALLAPMRALGPSVDTWASMPATELSVIHMDPPEPTPAAGNGTILADLPAAAIDALLSAAGPGVDTSLLAVDLRLLGGAVGRPAEGGGAVDHLPGRFLFFAVAVTPDAESHRRAEKEIAALLAGLAPWAHERTYSNFSETREPRSRFHTERTLARLAAVLDRVDPAGVVRGAHSVR